MRRETPYPVVALVGYTNAGKSTLFNRMTGATVMAMDKLFATLDPTMRSVTLPGGQKIILSDTVGFVSNLPTELVAAFRATLEEVLEADILLHIRDVAHPDSEAQKKDVEQVLKGLFGVHGLPQNLMEVANKIDQLGEDAKAALLARGAHAVSALTGEGVAGLCDTISAELKALYLQEMSVTLPLADGKVLAWLHAHATVANQTVDDDETISLTVFISDESLARFRQRFPVLATGAGASQPHDISG